MTCVTRARVDASQARQVGLARLNQTLSSTWDRFRSAVRRRRRLGDGTRGPMLLTYRARVRVVGKVGAPGVDTHPKRQAVI